MLVLLLLSQALHYLLTLKKFLVLKSLNIIFKDLPIVCFILSVVDHALRLQKLLLELLLLFQCHFHIGLKSTVLIL